MPRPSVVVGLDVVRRNVGTEVRPTLGVALSTRAACGHRVDVIGAAAEALGVAGLHRAQPADEATEAQHPLSLLGHRGSPRGVLSLPAKAVLGSRGGPRAGSAQSPRPRA